MYPSRTECFHVFISLCLAMSAFLKQKYKRAKTKKNKTKKKVSANKELPHSSVKPRVSVGGQAVTDATVVCDSRVTGTSQHSLRRC